MKEEFWHQRWEKNEIGFHQIKPNPFLVENFSKLNLKPNARIFVPLSGKTLDLSWFLEQGFRVVAIELNPIAIAALIEQLGLDFKILQSENLTLYAHPQIDIFEGNFFELTQEQLGNVDAIYDRAALVALPTDMRKNYTEHLIHITHAPPQLLMTFEYNQNSFEGPPFSVDTEEIEQLYSSFYDIQLLAHSALSDQFNKTQAQDKIWQLKPKR